MPSTPPKRVRRKILESVVVAAGVGLVTLGTFGTFTDEHTPFPPSSASHGR